MSVPDPRAIETRIAEIEQQLKDLQARVALLERSLGGRAEHSVDRTAVRQKVVYDWQA